ncbi:hypothetical protein KGQ24_01230 [Patescibacteria group bacterium]|nr:hypothetical protein [Patescibacteria group bacterium]
MGELIRGVDTPRVPQTDSPGSKAHRESHATGEYVEANEEDIALTRQFILNKYHVPPENVAIYEYKNRSKPQRKIRAFVLFTNNDDPQKNFYAEGNTAHAALNNMLGVEFANKLGVSDIHQLFDDETFLPKRPWVFRKGFLDPFHNGFKNFPGLREALLEEVEENKEINGLSDKGMESMANGDEDLPNWFLSTDTAKEAVHQPLVS